MCRIFLVRLAFVISPILKKTVAITKRNTKNITDVNNKQQIINSVGIYLFKVSNDNTRKMCEMY